MKKDKMSQTVLNPTVTAQTLSVLMASNNRLNSITCGVTINNGEDEDYTNVTLRFEGEEASIKGYPEHWKTWDEPIDGNEEYTYGDAESDGGIDEGVHEIEAIQFYISMKTEQEIFKQLKVCLEKQFLDPDFKDELTKTQKELVLYKIDLAIKNLS